MKTLWIIAIIVIIGLGALYMWNGSYGVAPAGDSVGESGEAMAEDKMEGGAMMDAVMVEITANGFSPSELTIPVGTMVRFINSDTAKHWPAADVHPVHQCYASFDSLRPLATGEEYEVKFEVAKTCGMHDHMNPGITGSIIVE
jgi:plastocyanin